MYNSSVVDLYLKFNKCLPMCCNAQPILKYMCHIVTVQCRKNPYVEQYDRVKVNEYLELERLAKVLEQLVDKFSGMVYCL